MRLEQPSQHPLEAQLIRGIIAYFQARWQISLPSTTRQARLKGFATLLEARPASTQALAAYTAGCNSS